MNPDEKEIRYAINLLIRYVKQLIYYYRLKRCFCCSEELERIVPNFIVNDGKIDIINFHFINYDNMTIPQTRYDIFHNYYFEDKIGHLRYTAVAIIGRYCLPVWGFSVDNDIERFEKDFYERIGRKLLQK